MDGVKDFNKTVAGASQIQSTQGEKAADEFLKKNGIDSGDSKVKAVVNIAANVGSISNTIARNAIVNKEVLEMNDLTGDDEKNLLNDVLTRKEKQRVELELQRVNNEVSEIQSQRDKMSAKGLETLELDTRLDELEAEKSSIISGTTVL